MPKSSYLGAPAPVPARVPLGLPSRPVPARPVPPRPAQPPTRVWWWGSLAVLVLVGILAWWQREALAPGRKPAVAARAFHTVRAWSGKLEKSFRVAGVTAAEKFSTLLAPQMRGTRGHGQGAMEFMLVLQKLMPGGSFVRKGQLVAEFDRQYMLLRLEDYKAMADQHERNVTRLKAALAVTRAAHDQLMIRAKGEMDKAAQDLQKIPILSQINSEKFRLNYEEAKSRYEQLRDDEKYVVISETAAIDRAEEDLRVARIEYDRAARNADRMLAKAPLDGMIVMLTTRRGSDTGQIQEGDQIYSGQPYMRIMDVRHMVVNASVNQVDVQQVRLGMRARVRFEAYPQLELPARVTAVGASATSGGWRGTYVRSVPVRLKLEQADPLVIPDLSVSADVVMESVENATVVPREAVFGGEGDAPQYAFVREPDGGWERRPLEVMMSNATAVAVKAGVNPGDVLAAEPPEPETGAQSHN